MIATSPSKDTLARASDFAAARSASRAGSWRQSGDRLPDPCSASIAGRETGVLPDALWSSRLRRLLPRIKSGGSRP